jgi:soluble lytic murein transglycosylase-like protein
MTGAASLVALALLAAPADDPRLLLVEQQLAERLPEALAEVERLLATSPDLARRLGLDYLRGRLLDRLGKPLEAKDAFLTALSTNPSLSLYSYFWLAVEYERLGHPEMAAGLVARVVAADPPFPQLGAAVRLLRRSLAAGGDCRVLGGIREARFAPVERREIQFARAECALRQGEPAKAWPLLMSVLAESRADEVAREAAELAAERLSLERDSRLTLAVGLTLHEHREFSRSSEVLDRLLPEGPPDGRPLAPAEFASRYARVRNDFWQGRYQAAALGFGRLVEQAARGEQRADALYQQGRCLELAGDWHGAAAAFRRTFEADPNGSWGSAGLLAALRLEWRSGREAGALELYGLLLGRRQGRDHAARAALFLASSDLVRGRADRAAPWLDQAALLGGSGPEVSFWRGRLAELAGDPGRAVASYLAALRADPYHPFADAARKRLAGPALAAATQAAGARLAGSGRLPDLAGAWLLLGEGQPQGAQALRALAGRLRDDPVASPYLRLAEVPVAEWQIWRAELRQPDEMLLALGLWEEGATAVPRHFPPSSPSLVFTGGRHLARAGEIQRALRLAESLEERLPASLPHRLLPVGYRELLYPLPYREEILGHAARHGVDPALLLAIIREESRFDPRALSAASARGLAQFTQPTSRRLAGRLGREEIPPGDLYLPEVSIALGAVYLEELGRLFPRAPLVAVAAYNAGEDQARLWMSHCFSRESAEYLSKVSFRQTRSYLAKVLASRAHYREIYGLKAAAEQ